MKSKGDLMLHTLCAYSYGSYKEGLDVARQELLRSFLVPVNFATERVVDSGCPALPPPSLHSTPHPLFWNLLRTQPVLPKSYSEGTSHSGSLRHHLRIFAFELTDRLSSVIRQPRKVAS